MAKDKDQKEFNLDQDEPIEGLDYESTDQDLDSQARDAVEGKGGEGPQVSQADREAVEGSPEYLAAQAHKGRPNLAEDDLRPENLGEGQVRRRPQGPQTAPEYGAGARNMAAGTVGPAGSASTGATHDSSGAAAASGKSNG